MLHTTTFRRALVALVVAAASAYSMSGVARADDQAPGVARISVASGDVALRHGQDGDAIGVTSNAPIEAGDYLSTGVAGRAEVQLDANDVLRASSNAQVRFTQLDSNAQVAQLASGTIEVRTFDGAGHATVQTPSADVNPADTGTYFVTVDDSGNTEVTARTGRVTINTPRGSQDLEPGRTMEITGSASDPQYQFIDAVAFGDFDQWAGDRDREYLQVASRDFPYEYVSNDIVGANDLSADGRWLNVDGGEVWQPSDVAANWMPYSDGAWTNEPYYGNTWVGREPWAWAPYHYGRWFYANDIGWVWDPGSRDEQPAWSPALVAFFGFGNGASIGWIPLGPSDPWHPWYGNGGNTIVYNTTINNYTNYHRGYVGLPIGSWQRGDFNPIRLHTESPRNARVIAGRFPIAPTQRNNTFGNRTVVGTNFRRPMFERFTSISTNAPLRRSTIRMTTEQAPRTTWQRFGSTTNTQRTDVQTRTFTQPQRSNTTWQRFNGSPSTMQRPTSSYQTPYSRQPQNYQQPTYQRPTRSYQQPVIQRPTSLYQGPNARQPQNYQRPTYQEPTRSYQQPTRSYQQPRVDYQRPVMQRPTSSYQGPSSRQPQNYQRPAPVQRPPSNPQRPHKPGPGGG